MDRRQYGSVFMVGAALGLAGQAAFLLVAAFALVATITGHSGALTFWPWLLSAILNGANSLYGLVAGRELRRGERWAVKHVRVNLILAFVLQALSVEALTLGSRWALPLMLIASPWGVVYWVTMFVLSWHLRWDTGPSGLRSPDGQWWWDGTAWQPAPGSAVSSSPANQPGVRPALAAAASLGCLAGGLAVGFGAMTAATSLVMVRELGALFGTGKLPGSSAFELLWLPVLLLLIGFGLIAAPIGLGVHVVRSSPGSGLKALGAIDIGLGSLALLLLTSFMSLQLLVNPQLLR